MKKKAKKNDVHLHRRSKTSCLLSRQRVSVFRKKNIICWTAGGDGTDRSSFCPQEKNLVGISFRVLDCSGVKLEHFLKYVDFGFHSEQPGTFSTFYIVEANYDYFLAFHGCRTYLKSRLWLDDRI